MEGQGLGVWVEFRVLLDLELSNLGLGLRAFAPISDASFLVPVLGSVLDSLKHGYL